MGFAQVKSNPWKKGEQPRRRRLVLWPETFWKQLCERASGEMALRAGNCPNGWVSPECVEMIRQMNGRLGE